MTSTDRSIGSLLGDTRVRLGLLFAGTLAFFVPTLVAYHDVWIAQPYTHGYLIAAATLWLLWRERAALRPTSEEWKEPLTIAAVLSVAWAIGAIADARVVVLATLPGLLLCWGAAVFGPAAARRIAPIVAVFLLAVPLWSVVTGPLRSVTVAVCDVALRLARVPFEVEGSVIHIQYGSFLIEDACAGFNYFMAGLSVGAIYAMSFLRTWPARAVFVAVAVAMAIVGNWIRVSSLIVIGHATRMQAGIIYDHGTYGWGIFFAGLLLLIPAARAVERWERSRLRDDARRRAAHPARGATRPRPDEAERAQPADPPPERGLPRAPTRPTRSAARASAVVLVGPALYLSVGALPAVDVEAATLSAQGSWRQVPADPGTGAWEPAYVGADAHHVATWSGEGARVRVDRLEYAAQSQRAELIGYENAIAPPDLLVTERLFGPVGPRRRFVNEAIVREGRSYLLVWYWYRVGGVETASPLKAKLLEVVAFLRRRTLSELLAVSAACGPEDCRAASETLGAFLAAEARSDVEDD